LEINILKRMKQIALLALSMLAVCLIACHRNHGVEPQPVPQSRNLPVITVSVGAPVEYTTVGSVVSDQRVDVTSRLSGYIRAVLVHEGDRVRRGQVLVRLDASDVEGGIRQAQAGVSAADAAFRDAEADREHFQRLFEHETVSDNELRKVVLKDEAARETLNQARAVYDTACAQREYAVIKSPVDGTVVARAKLAGDLALPGAPILTLESEHGLLFEAFVDVDRESMATIATGKPVEVRIDGLSAPLKGTIIVSPDNASRRELNVAVRQELKTNGTLAPEDHTFRVLVPRQDMTGAERSTEPTAGGSKTDARCAAIAAAGRSSASLPGCRTTAEWTRDWNTASKTS
jgi:RND family efflux transporter MFP subunit